MFQNAFSAVKMLAIIGAMTDLLASCATSEKSPPYKSAILSSVAMH